MKTVGIVLLVLLGIAVGAALFVLEVNMIVWNVTDIVDKGINFWNTFWLALVAGSGIVGVKAIK